jgi:hypothetical protein
LTLATTTKSERKSAAPVHPGAKMVFDGPTWRVIEIENKGPVGKEAACFYGGNNKKLDGVHLHLVLTNGLIVILKMDRYMLYTNKMIRTFQMKQDYQKTDTNSIFHQINLWIRMTVNKT